ncbi:hypothetical protein SZN_02202 [Streptomyces zinciresistens K42]|uniref:Uncharacterized protein n=2 Tax=Streptomyces TaxID=1883 RepID=G2G4N7_9ACTN|nr:hypothetical protein [Streptomyces zinciresistens]EGX61510.1 hypothetical protein SZN_02202 [Streptomyces zinciresistens K42]
MPSTPPPVAPHASEASRLLCAGAYLDAAYRDRVVEELDLNDQRIAAPSLGYDAARVLAHALRARRLELGWAGAIVGLWVVGLFATDFLLVGYLLPSLLLAMGAAVRGDGDGPPFARRLAAFAIRWLGRIVFALFLAATVVFAFSDADSASSEPVCEAYDAAGYCQSYSSGGSPGFWGFFEGLLPGLSQMVGGDGTVEPLQAWLALVLFVGVAVCTGAQRSQFARALGAELSPERFADAAADPAENTESRRFQRLKERIRLEQRAPLIMYHGARPFCGAGAAYDTWVLAVELRPDGVRKVRPMSNRTILDAVRPLVEGLRLPSEYAGHAVRDRLRWLEVDECVFLPAEGLGRREDAPYREEAFEEHRARAVEEGAEKRRHFLRVRVGGWEEELVVTVYVRIHTQGRMLMLEIAPHVLQPIRADFKDADRTAHRFRSNNLFGRATWAVGQVPGASIRSLATLGHGAAYGWQLLAGGYANALPDGPAVSVRELAAARSGSLFQQMDVDRYLRSVQDRIANGVRTALADHGYQTGEFVQKVVNISRGGVHIDSVAGSTFAVGSHARASSGTGPGTPHHHSTTHSGSGPRHQRGGDSDGNG